MPAALRPARSLFAVVLTLLLASAAAPEVHAQPLADTLFAWRGYARTAKTQVTVYPAPPDDDRRAQTVILRELADNRGPSTIDDVRYLAEQIGRTLGVVPEEAYWVFHWGAFSFDGAEDGAKEIFLRATFRRTKTGNLASPYWRVVSRDEVRELTDRRFD
jgi:hypothetical protein